MQKLPLRPTLSRHDLLKLVAAGGIAAVGGYELWDVAPWLDYEGHARKIRKPLEMSDEKRRTVAKSLLGLPVYATLAASGHNTQPWKFVVGPDTIEIHPDYARRLAVVDPGDRELWISLGCALENLRIAARAVGYAPEVTYPGTDDFISVRLTADTPQGSDLFDAMPIRQNTRSEYDGKPIRGSDLDRVRSLPLEPGVMLHWVLNPADLLTVEEYARQGNLNQYANKAFVKELIGWVRFNKREALASCDGLYSRCVGSPDVPRWLGRTFVAGTKPAQQADADTKKLRGSSGAVIVASVSEDRTAWVRTGQVYERMALKMTSLNIKSAFLNQPLEVATVRQQLQIAIGLGEARPQLLVRFGYAEPMPYSLRRPVAQVIG